MQVDVCVATYKRPTLLKKLLHSLIRQQLDHNVTMRIVVVDNDVDESARQIVEDCAAAIAITVSYSKECVQNIALARNHALSLCRGDYIAFIDDDEEAAHDWLGNLIDNARRYNADVVFGPVVPVYPEDTPKWVRRGHFFERNRRPTGTPCEHGGAGNVLISTTVLQTTGLRFNPAYGLTGGEDTEFFYRLGQHGAQMVWCDEALVTEPVAKKRMTPAWLIRRAFRGGQMYGRLLVSPKPIPARIPWVIQRVTYLAMAVALLPLAWLWGKDAGVRTLMKISSNLGHLTSQSGWLYEGYR